MKHKTKHLWCFYVLWILLSTILISLKIGQFCSGPECYWYTFYYACVSLQKYISQNLNQEGTKTQCYWLLNDKQSITSFLLGTSNLTYWLQMPWLWNYHKAVTCHEYMMHLCQVTHLQQNEKCCQTSHFFVISMTNPFFVSWQCHYIIIIN